MYLPPGDPATRRRRYAVAHKHNLSISQVLECVGREVVRAQVVRRGSSARGAHYRFRVKGGTRRIANGEDRSGRAATSSPACVSFARPTRS